MCMVEARGEFEGTCPHEEFLNLESVLLSNWPAILAENKNPIYETCFIGKYTLKSAYIDGGA